MKPRLFTITLLTLLLAGLSPAEGRIPILLYHRFGPVVTDSMTVTTNVFESQLKYLRENGYTAIPLRHLVEYHLGKRQTLPSRSIVITVDDGHKTAYSDLYPLLRRYHIPAAVFIYPSAISNASYAMTWDELREIRRSGLVDLQAHTFWHPNFKTEKRKLNPADYEKFVNMQLKKSKEKLEKELDTQVDMLAWPFGIYDEDLIRKAAEAGYIAAFSMERRHADPSSSVMALPRYLINDADTGKTFVRIVGGPPCS
jgi:peptidoglycan/xylan/chitin deacetylase (PgdA/CDA1 family)